eukprot:2028005-Alexandrium_andersonii.AAC.1
MVRADDSPHREATQQTVANHCKLLQAFAAPIAHLSVYARRWPNTACPWRPPVVPALAWMDGGEEWQRRAGSVGRLGV